MRTTLGPKGSKRQKLIVSGENVGKLLAELEPDVRLTVETAISTGVRIPEIIGLKWRFVDVDRGVIRVAER